MRRALFNLISIGCGKECKHKDIYFQVLKSAQTTLRPPFPSVAKGALHSTLQPTICLKQFSSVCTNRSSFVRGDEFYLAASQKTEQCRLRAEHFEEVSISVQAKAQKGLEESQTCCKQSMEVSKLAVLASSCPCCNISLKCYAGRKKTSSVIMRPVRTHRKNASGYKVSSA